MPDDLKEKLKTLMPAPAKKAAPAVEVSETCPDCGYEGAEAKSTKARGEYRRCLKCQNEWEIKAPEAVAV